MSVSAEEFTKMAGEFNRTNPEQVLEMIDNKEDFVLFLGRETCPYSRVFIPKFYEVVQEEGLEVYFIHSQDEDHLNEIEALRSSYDMPTVPSLLVAKNGSVETVSDSSLSKDEIREFISI